MTRIGITGHSNLTPATADLVARAIRDALSGERLDRLVGVSCLARGADQIFARAVLDLGGRVEAILPAADYRARKVEPDDRARFDALAAASTVRTLPFEESGREAYMAAGEAVLDTVDRLVAVWDGEPSGGLGGTADVVDAARRRGIPVTIVWPAGARRH